MRPQSVLPSGGRRDRLERIAARLRAATPGPWLRLGIEGTPYTIVAPAAGNGHGAAPLVAFARTAEDAELVEHARDDLEWLLALALATPPEGAGP